MKHFMIYEESYKDQVLQKYSYKDELFHQISKKKKKNLWQSNFPVLEVWLFCRFTEVQVKISVASGIITFFFFSLYSAAKSSIHQCNIHAVTFFCEIEALIISNPLSRDHVSHLLQITTEGFVVDGANQQPPTVDRRCAGANDHLAVVSVDLSHHRLITVDVLDANDLQINK